MTLGSHLIEPSITIANGGIGDSHPYLSGVTIPSYIGAANPSDNSWVSGVVNDISSVSWLASQEIGSVPNWIEQL
jgi:hypothetical protein